MIPDSYSVEGSGSRQLFFFPFQKQIPSVFHSVQRPDEDYFSGVFADADGQYIAYMQCPDYGQVSIDFPASPSKFGSTAMLITNKHV